MSSHAATSNSLWFPPEWCKVMKFWGPGFVMQGSGCGVLGIKV